MTLVSGLLLLVATVAFMEGFAYVMHRWVMHGFLWSLHASHHAPRTGIFERNDWFAVVFALPSIALIDMGVNRGFGMPALLVGVGIAIYGLIYFGFHDVIVHRRLKHSWRPTTPYLRRIVQAHRLHHVIETKHGTVSFGFLWAPPVRALKAELAARASGDVRAPRRAPASTIRRGG